MAHLTLNQWAREFFGETKELPEDKHCLRTYEEIIEDYGLNDIEERADFIRGYVANSDIIGSVKDIWGEDVRVRDNDFAGGTIEQSVLHRINGERPEYDCPVSDDYSHLLGDEYDKYREMLELKIANAAKA